MKPRNHVSRSPARCLFPCLLLAVPLLLGAGAGADEGPDTPLTVSGVVVDGTGAPLEGLQAVLTVSKVSLSIKPFGKVPRKVSERTTLTNGSGEFSLQWPWKRGYNSFELALGVPYRDGKTDRLHVLETRDLTKRVKASRSVTVMIDIQDTSFVEERKRFLATFTSADQHRVYEDMGQPQRVDSVHTGERTEITWWYFKHGRLYRFADGVLIEEKDFEAVEPL